MTVEALILATLGPLASSRCYPDVAPVDVQALPRITFQQVGGEAVNFVEAALPDKENSRFQINDWGSTRLMVAALARQGKAALKAEPALRTTVLGEMVALYEPITGLYGARQDFSFWV